jgi:hypothetical protein
MAKEKPKVSYEFGSMNELAAEFAQRAFKAAQRAGWAIGKYKKGFEKESEIWACAADIVENTTIVSKEEKC